MKNYIKAVNVVGVTFAYHEDGRPYGLCRVTSLVYVATAGGPIVSEAYGYGYVRELARSFWGIRETVCVKAEGLDIAGNDAEEILSGAVRGITLSV